MSQIHTRTIENAPEGTRVIVTADGCPHPVGTLLFVYTAGGNGAWVLTRRHSATIGAFVAENAEWYASSHLDFAPPSVPPAR